ncbi:MAG: isoamylase early set domain-containing protein [Nitrospirae bacterium]|nr:isoamylase early set domain-containing protein [Nitrospirota bacterium]
MYRKKRQTAVADNKLKKIRIKDIEVKNSDVSTAETKKSELPQEALELPHAENKTAQLQKSPEHKTKEKPVSPKKAVPASGFKKVYIEDTNICRVTFTLQKEAAPNAVTVAIAGDFNAWNTSSHMMRQSRNGNFTITIDLDADKDYQFKYIVDGTIWENDWKADRYEADNSVVVV